MDMQKTILVVDDKANVRTLLREYLTEQGYRVVVAENGRLALFTARQEKPDLILLDIMMPEMDGTDFHAYLSQRSRHTRHFLDSQIGRNRQSAGAGTGRR